MAVNTALKNWNVRFPPGILERYRVLQPISEKEDRRIYLAEELEGPQRQCVIKVTCPGSPDSALREFSLLRSLDHPAIPAAIDYHDWEEREYLVREYAQGETLDAILTRDGVFTESAVLHIAESLCDVISYLHQRRPPVIYRDVKPQNIVIGRGGRVFLIDFGIARFYDKEKSFDTQYMGSVDFAPPEQFGFSRTDLRSDIYAVGKLMIYLSTGQSDLQSYDHRSCSPRLSRIIRRCVQLSPERRYQSAEALSKAIGSALDPRGRMPVLLGVAAACAVAAGSIGLWLWSSPQQAP